MDMVRIVQILNIFFDLTSRNLAPAIAGVSSIVLSLYVAYKWDFIKAKMIQIETDRKRAQDQAVNKTQNSKAEADAKVAEDKINEVLNGRT